MKKLLLLCMVFLVAVIGVFAQDIAPLTPPSPTDDVAISFPPPIYVVNDEVTVVGSASAVGMANYFIEFRPLVITDPSATPEPDTRPWFPATLPQLNPVTNDVLGLWDTATAPDGTYELRLVVNITGQSPRFFRVSPLRVLNNPAALSPFAQVNTQPSNPSFPPLQPSPTAFGGVSASIQATQSAVATALAGGSTTGNTGSGVVTNPSGEPFVVANTDVNVRSGDSTAYPRIASLLAGETARLIGVSSTGSGWYYIEVGGRRGFLAPSTVRVEGNIASLSRINPPAIPATATPTPVPAQGDLTANTPAINPIAPICSQAFTVFANVTNAGTAPTTGGTQVTLSDRHVASGTVSNVTTVNIPVLAPGENYVVSATMTVTIFYNEEHDIVVNVDSSNQLIETNEGNNVITKRYTLLQGTC